MKKRILGLAIGFILIGVNLYAADGDLQVNGSVGIGTAPNPTYKLDVNGTAALRGSVWTSGTNIEVRGLSPGSNYAYIDFRGDDTYTDYGLRLLRGNTGPNTWSELTHRGAGGLYIQTIEAAPLIFRTASVDRMTVSYSGYVGIGTAYPASALDTAGTIRTTSYAAPASGTGVEMYYISGIGRILAFDRTPPGAYRDLGLGISNGYQLYLKSNGNVGVGTGTPGNILSVLQYSATDPVADSWTIYPCDRTTKDVIRTLPNQSGALDRLLAVELYEWKRKPIVSDEEIKTEPEKVMTPDELEKRRQELSAAKSQLPKFQARRVGVMLDDPNIPEEIVSLDGAGQKGIDLAGYIGWLHATIKELALRVQELEKR
jgi:hypothetical protein